MCRIEQVVSTNGISVMARGIAEAPHVEGLYNPLNLSRERGVWPVYARSNKSCEAGPNDGCRCNRNPGANSGFPSRCAVSAKLTAAKYKSETAIKAGKSSMVAYSAAISRFAASK